MPIQIKTKNTPPPALSQSANAKFGPTRSPKYTAKFFQGRQAKTRLSALAIVPVVLELLAPISVIDVGCGTGEFLEVFQEHGVREVLGIDGDYVDRNLLAISQENFRDIDLSLPFTQDKRYDLALCLEVAEHIAPETASTFIESLTQLAPIILFSAAIPFQGGDHHVNEQWPEYWAQLFKEKGFQPVDALRKRIWNNQQIEFWYRQNIILFCNEDALSKNNFLFREFSETNQNMLSVVHPEMYMECNTKYVRSLRKILAYAWRVKNTTKKMLQK